MAEAKNQAMNDAAPGFLKAHAGEGQEITQEGLAISYLQILQDLSDAVKNKVPGAEPGCFFNTGNQQVLGPTIEVILVAYALVWDERDKGGKTVDRYEPFQCEFTEQPNPNNPRFPKKINPKTGNDIIETFAYALVLKDHPECGYLMHTAGIGSMKTYRRWNNMRTQDFLSNGDQAPIFARSWILSTEPRMSKTTGKMYYALANVERGNWTSEDFYNKTIAAARAASTRLMLAAPAAADDAPAEEEG